MGYAARREGSCFSGEKPEKFILWSCSTSAVQHNHSFSPPKLLEELSWNKVFKREL